jgi:hypothetical protein
VGGPALIARKCEHCQSDFEARSVLVEYGQARYCGKACSSAARRKARVVVACRQCGDEFSVSPAVAAGGRGRGKYCGKPCANLTHSQDRRPLVDRFWEKVDKGEIGACWIWTGAACKKGYGNIGTGGREGKDVIVTRLICEWTHGPIPPGMMVCHDCPGGENPRCVNPAHLFLGSAQDNMTDKVEKGRQLRGETVPNSKLCDSDVVEIRDRYREKSANQGELARRFHVSRPTISEIVNRITWKHFD